MAHVRAYKSGGYLKAFRDHAVEHIRQVDNVLEHGLAGAFEQKLTVSKSIFSPVTVNDNFLHVSRTYPKYHVLQGCAKKLLS